MPSPTDAKIRCFSGNVYMNEYHDTEWGVPSHDDRHLFEMLILEGAQAGLSWDTVLRKRKGYKKAFHNFSPDNVAKMSDDALEVLLLNTEVIRNRLKIYSARKNAVAFLQISQEFGSFSKYLWEFVDGSPVINRWKDAASIPVTTSISDTLSKDLKKRGMSFVGSTIIYSYMQAVGLVNDHIETCWLNN